MTRRTNHATDDGERNDEVLPTVVPIWRDRWFDRLRTPGRRKALAFIGGALLVTAMVMVATGRDAVTWVGLPTLMIAMLLNLVTRVMADAPSHRLDERMVAARNKAFRTAYYVLGGGLIAIVVLVLAAGSGEQAVIERSQLLGIAWCAAMATMLLPSAILAWTEELI